MCGIAGIWNFNGVAINKEALDRVNSLLNHRGPDGRGKYVENNFALSSTRLALIDLKHSSQPIFSRDKRFILVGNGEIYNYQELRSELMKKGCQFSTDGDMEVIMHSLILDGPQSLSKLRGPFAFAIWDRKSKQLWLGRDRWGERPLFTYCDKNSFIFVSEFQAFKAFVQGMFTVDILELISFVGLGRYTVGKTLFKNLIPVTPGTVLQVGENNKIVHRFFTLRNFTQRTASEKSLENINECIDQAIERTLISHRPIGIAFSGGIDSTVILDFALRKKTNIRTFTLVAEGKADPNADRSRVLSRFFNTQHTEIAFRIPPVQEVINCISKRLDSPAGEPTILHNDALHKVVASQVPVLLAGHGADEIFSGYVRYLYNQDWLLNVSRFQTEELPYKFFTELGPSASYMHWCRMQELIEWLFKAEKYLDKDIFHAVKLSNILENVKQILIKFRSESPLNQAQLLDFFIFQSYVNFTLPDENAMSHSLEVRTPFFDADLVELAFSLNPKERLRNGKTKSVLRERLSKIVPESLVDAKKVGFDDSFDYVCWLEKNKIEVLGYIIEGKLSQVKLLNPLILNELRENHDFYRKHWMFVWRLFSISAWLNENSQLINL